jgi:uncharacterized protein (TIGR03089 family)
MTVTDQLLGPLLRADPARPRMTHYDDTAGSRVELSGTTLANWAAKTANWLRDELGVQPGDTVAVLLPPHWQTAGALLGAWWCGATVTSSPAAAAVALCARDRLDEAGSAAEVAVLGLDPLGASVRELPRGVHDFAGEVRVHADSFTPAGAGPQAETVLAAARACAAQLRLRPADRLLCTTGWDATVPGEVLLAVLSVDGSLVQCSGADPAVLPGRCAAERVTVTLGVSVPLRRRAG